MLCDKFQIFLSLDAKRSQKMTDFNENFGMTKKLRFAFVLGVTSKKFRRDFIILDTSDAM